MAHRVLYTEILANYVYNIRLRLEIKKKTWTMHYPPYHHEQVQVW